MPVYVLLFNAGTNQEGIHTLNVGGRNIVLMFEDEDDALRFSGLLEAQDFPALSVEGFNDEEIIDFCSGANYDCQLVPKGQSVLMPPEKTLDTLDIDRQDNDRADADGAVQGDRPQTSQTDLDEGDLDQLRQRLEKLL